jgi:hypothetical protein
MGVTIVVPSGATKLSDKRTCTNAGLKKGMALPADLVSTTDGKPIANNARRTKSFFICLLMSKRDVIKDK